MPVVVPGMSLENLKLLRLRRCSTPGEEPSSLSICVLSDSTSCSASAEMRFRMTLIAVDRWVGVRMPSSSSRTSVTR